MFACCLPPLCGLLLFAASPAAVENWFLPYTPDKHTVVLLHFDDEGEKELNAAPAVEGKPHVSAFDLLNGAARDTGRFGRGIRLDGVKAMVQSPLTKDLRFSNKQDFTVEMWVRPVQEAPVALFTLAGQYYLWLDSAKQGGWTWFYYRGASAALGRVNFGKLPIAVDQWQHVALVHHNDRTVRVYVNGAQAAETTYEDEGDRVAQGAKICFGAFDGWAKFLQGGMDEVRVSNCARVFEPVLPQDVRKGDQVRLGIDPARLPENVAKVHVRLVAESGSVLFDGNVSRKELSEEFFAATPQFPKGRHKADVTFSDASGTVLSTVSGELRYTGEAREDLAQQLAAIEAACAKGSAGVAPDRLKSVQMMVESARQRLASGDRVVAKTRTIAAERIAQAIRSGQAAYRAAMHNKVRAAPVPSEGRVMTSWYATEPARALEVLPWAKRLGANELDASRFRVTPEGLAAWKQAGYHTSVIGRISTQYPEWIKEHAEHAQVGYWLSEFVEAKSSILEIPLESPRWHKICHRMDPKKYWKVVAKSANEARAVMDWQFDAAAERVRVRAATPGLRYGVYFMIESKSCGDPLRPGFVEACLTLLREDLARYRHSTEVMGLDGLAYIYPAETPGGGWDWHSYTMAAHPQSQELFAKETRIPFDPQWLVGPHPAIDTVPDPRYLAWMAWVQKSLRPWLIQIGALCAEHGVRSWFYWGDAHVGIEPYLGSLEAGIREIDLEGDDPLAMRSLIDFPGDVKRRFRLEWLDAKAVASDATAARVFREWTYALRALLAKPPDSLYWLRLEEIDKAPDPAVREDLVESMVEVSDEFRMIADRLSGSRAFAHPINVYVVHSWGKVYSWRGPLLLTHLTDLPVHVQFLSFAEIESDGVPRDASALFMYGMPNTAWSGGRWWESGKVGSAVQKFVKAGGGLVALQAASHLDSPQPHWGLGDLLGVSPGGVKVKDPTLSRLPSAASHWLAAEIANVPEPQECFAVTPLRGSSVLYALATRTYSAPGVVVSQFGRGRVVYFSGWSPEYSFSRLMRRAIFWAAKREADFLRLDVTGAEGLFVYAYPEQRLLALLNQGVDLAKATMRCDPRILGVKGTVRLLDVATGERLWEGTSSRLASGVSIQAIPMCARLIQVEDTTARTEKETRTQSTPSASKPPTEALRTWTDSSGKFRVDAEFVAVASGEVQLRKATGEVISVPLDRLSADDQAWIHRHSR